MYATVPAGSEAAPGVGPVLGVLSGCSWLSPKSDTFAVKLRWFSCGAQPSSGIHARYRVLLALRPSPDRGSHGIVIGIGMHRDAAMYSNLEAGNSYNRDPCAQKWELGIHRAGGQQQDFWLQV